jgi:hypothetical protein
MDAVTDEETVLVITVKVAVVPLAGTVTEVGTEATSKLVLESVTIAPPVGAGPVRVTVPAELARPPTTAVGERVNDFTCGAFTVSIAASWTVPRVAWIVACAVVETAVVVMEKVAEDRPAAKVTEAGTVAAALLEDRLTTLPPVGAMPVRVTVPVEPVPPVTEVGLIVTDESCGGFTVSAALNDPLKEAPMLTTAVVLTARVVMVKCAEVVPDGMVTEEGGVATTELVVDSVTTAPVNGAGPFSVTVPVLEAPPMTEFGDTVMDCNATGVPVKLIPVIGVPE